MDVMERQGTERQARLGKRVMFGCALLGRVEVWQARLCVVWLARFVERWFGRQGVARRGEARYARVGMAGDMPKEDKA